MTILKVSINPAIFKVSSVVKVYPSLTLADKIGIKCEFLALRNKYQKEASVKLALTLQANIRQV